MVLEWLLFENGGIRSFHIECRKGFIAKIHLPKVEFDYFNAIMGQIWVAFNYSYSIKVYFRLSKSHFRFGCLASAARPFLEAREV